MSMGILFQGLKEFFSYYIPKDTPSIAEQNDLFELFYIICLLNFHNPTKTNSMIFWQSIFIVCLLTFFVVTRMVLPATLAPRIVEGVGANLSEGWGRRWGWGWGCRCGWGQDRKWVSVLIWAWYGPGEQMSLGSNCRGSICPGSIFHGIIFCS
jgi:hypothetical protein